ncbi:MAG: hypothetical protein LBK62_09320 [Treponema sp.]|jgi:hypothetical protein|nr:hypothetical protein [Treponema sp.]
MYKKTGFCLLFVLLISAATLTAQQLNSVPLGHAAYNLIEMGVLRGVITPPPSAKPWSEVTITGKLRGMLDAPAGKFSKKELDIITGVLAPFERKNGIDYKAGRYYGEKPVLGQRVSLESGMNWGSDFSVKAPDAKIGSVNTGELYLAGDMGEHFSWNFRGRAGFFSIGRTQLGLHPDPLYVDPKYGPYDGNPNSQGHHYYYDIPSQSWSPVYSIPAFFPYTFSKQWEAGVFAPSDMAGYGGWPEKFAFGYEIISEMNTGLFSNLMTFRFGRMRRDWGPESSGSSLFMNGQARPFMAIEGSVTPYSWLRFSVLTGVLEYQNNNNQWTDSDPFQSLFSLTYLELDSGKHFHFDFGSATIWPKRFELGYIFPLNSNFFYQNNVGDFDNLGLFADLEYRWPGLFKIWGSLYLDEIRPVLGSFFSLDRNMYAYQGGIKADIKGLPFGAFTVRYTKIEPYTYTHEYTETPWNRVPSDTAYLNNGESLGFYLPPNSDELLIRLESMFRPDAGAHVQYQLIRHGADYGYGRVDGSSLRDKIVKDDNSEKHFLRDGVYQWDHVIKLGGSYSLKSRNIPLSLYAETGLVVTRFTINNNFGSGSENEGDFHALDDAEYNADTGFIFSLGFKLFP